MAQRAFPPQPQLHEMRTRPASSSRVHLVETRDARQIRVQISPLAIHRGEWPPSHEEVDRWIYPELGLGL